MSTPLHLDEETTDDILYLARTAEIPDLLTLLASLSTKHSVSALKILSQARDPYTGNTALHYASANGHTNVILSLTRSGPGAESQYAAVKTLVVQANDAGNTPLHYASLNGHLPSLKILFLALLPPPASFDPIKFETSETGLASAPRNPDDAAREEVAKLNEEQRKGVLKILEMKNKADRDAAGEAEAAVKDEVVGWLLGVMDRLEGGGDGGGGASGEQNGEEEEMKISMGDTTGNDVAKEVGEIKIED